MMNRCTNPNDKFFPRYGGRGIKVCKRWQNVRLFVADNEALYSRGLLLDRKNNDGHYRPSNCRWVTTEVQANNKSNSRFIEYRGRKQTLAQWAKELGIHRRTLSSRIDAMGWTMERAFKGKGRSR
jgi:hypothetical protein